MSPRLLATFLSAFAIYFGLAAAQVALAQQKTSKTNPQVTRGKYLVQIAGCNDCHTAGYAPSGGKVPESQWLMGDKLGWRGPWGTTYPINLRQYMAPLTQAQWLHIAKTKEMRPPMPWFALREMTNRDLSAIYSYVKSLGPAGEPAPAYLPPDQAPQGPVIQFPAPPK